MEHIAVNNLVSISEQSLYQHGWLTPIQTDKAPERDRSHQHINSLSAYHLKKIKSSEQKHKQKSFEISSKLITFKKPAKERVKTRNQKVLNKGKFPSLPIKLSPNKELKLLINKYHSKTNSTVDVCNTINLWERAQNRVKCRQYTEVFQKFKSQHKNQKSGEKARDNNFSNKTLTDFIEASAFFSQSDTTKQLKETSKSLFDPPKCKHAVQLYSVIRSNIPKQNIAMSQLSNVSSQEDLLISKAEIQPRKKPFFVKKFITRNPRSKQEKSHSLFIA